MIDVTFGEKVPETKAAFAVQSEAKMEQIRLHDKKIRVADSADRVKLFHKWKCDKQKFWDHEEEEMFQQYEIDEDDVMPNKKNPFQLKLNISGHSDNQSTKDKLSSKLNRNTQSSFLVKPNYSIRPKNLSFSSRKGSKMDESERSPEKSKMLDSNTQSQIFHPLKRALSSKSIGFTTVIQTESKQFC